jgi:hypothetical protein
MLVMQCKGLLMIEKKECFIKEKQSMIEVIQNAKTES